MQKSEIVPIGSYAIPAVQIANSAVPPGETATFMARTQVSLGIQKIMLEDDCEFVDAHLVEKKLETVPIGTRLDISVPFFIRVRNTSDRSKEFFPAVVGQILYRKGKQALLPFARVEDMQDASMRVKIAPGSSAYLTKMFAKTFEPKRLLARSEQLDSLRLEDVKIGNNSQIAAAGSIALSFFTEGRSPEIFSDSVPAGMNLSVRVFNASGVVAEVEIEIEGRIVENDKPAPAVLRPIGKKGRKGKFN